MLTTKHRHITYSIYQYLPIHRQRGDTALFIATQQGHVEVVRLLLDRGADIDAKTNVSYITMESDSTKLSQTLREYHSAMVTTR